MIKKISKLVLLCFVAFSFQFCVDEELQNPQPDDDASKRRLRPSANAGEDVVITLPTNTTIVDGSNSTDSRGELKSYIWTKVAGPVSATFTNPSAAKTEVKDLIEGIYTFRLTVTNSLNNKDYDDVVVTVNKNPTTTTAQSTPTLTGTLLFNGVMNTASIAKYTDWCSIQPWLDDIKRAGFTSIGTSCNDGYVVSEMVSDGGINVLRAQVIGSDPSDAARFQTETYLPNADMGVYHHTQRMKLSGDIEFIRQYPEAIGPKSGNAWFTVWEAWMGYSVTRQNLSISKDRGVGAPLKWDLMHETGNFQTIWWSTPNTTFPVPINKWFTMDVYVKSGEGTNGQLKIIITVDGEAPVALFDEKKTTTVPGQPNVFRRKNDHMKFYMGGALRDFMLNANKRLEVWYGDYKIYKD